MPPKVKKEEKDVKKATGKGQQINLKELVPQDLKQNPREPKIGIKIKENISEVVQKQQEIFIKQQEPEEWPGDEFSAAQDLGRESNVQFFDNLKINLPPSFQKVESQIIFWRRPREFLFQEIKEDEVKQFYINPNLSKNQKILSRIKNQLHLNLSKEKHGLSEGKKNKSILIKHHPYVSEEVQDDSSPLLKNRSRLNQEDVKEIKRKEWAIKTLKIFNTQKRKETQEEMEIRKAKKAEYLKEQQALLQQQKGKGKVQQQVINSQQDEEEEEIEIEEVKMNSIDMMFGEELSELSKWVGSVFQMIKDRKIVDSVTGQQLHQKIYPQHNGIPLYNDVGRYWIKLHYMGRFVKIEIDDKIPCSVKEKVSLFPKTEYSNELWPMLFTKALLKLQQIHFYDQTAFNREVGQGWILYSLMGLMPQDLNINSIDDLMWKFIQLKTNDHNYHSPSAYFSLYSNTKFKPKLENNFIGSQKQKIIQSKNKLQDKNNKKISQKVESMTQIQYISVNDDRIMSKNNITDNKNNQSEDLRQKKDKGQTTINNKLQIQQPDYTQTGFCYSVIDSFFNENFNMVYVKGKSEEEIKLREKYFNLNKVNLQKLSKEAKLDYRRQKKEMKEQIQQEDKLKIELITKAPIQYRMLKIGSRVVNQALLDYICQFTDKEIMIGKKCIMNKIKMPPNYDLPEIKNDDKSVISLSLASQMTEGSFHVKPLEDFGNLPNLVEPINRLKSGQWIQDYDLKNAFEKMQIYYDLNRQAHQERLQCSVQQQQQQVLMVQSNSEVNSSRTMHLVVGFMAQRNINSQIPQPFMTLTKFDYNQFKHIKQFTSLNNSLIDTALIILDNKNHVFKINTYSPLDYHLAIACDNPFKIIPEIQYLQDYEAYFYKQFTIDYSPMNKKDYYMIAKFRLQVSQSSQNNSLSVLLKMNNSTINSQLRIKIVEIFNKESYNNQNLNLREIEGVERNLMEQQIINVHQLNRVILNKNSDYILAVEGIFNNQIGEEGQVELEMLYQEEQEDNLQIFQYELNEQHEYVDRYIHNQYGIIFTDKIFIQQQSDQFFGANTSFVLSLKRTILKEVKEIKDNKQVDKNKKQIQQQVQEEEFEEIELDDNYQRMIYFQIYIKQDNIEHIIFNVKGYNKIIVSNFQFFAGFNYQIRAGFDLQLDQSYNQTTGINNELIWILKVITCVDQNICLVKDLTKEQTENQIRQQWELQQQGRAEKAAKERRKYQIKKKIKNNQQITEEEQILISEQRQMKNKQQQDEQLLDKKGDKKQQQQKKEVANVKKDPKQQVIQEEKVQEIKREAPKSKEHQMLEIQEFLERMEGNRAINFKPVHQGLVNLRSDEELAALKETIKMEKEHLYGLLSQELIQRQEVLKRIEQDKEKIKKMETDIREVDEVIQEREQFRQQFMIKKEQEVKLLQLCIIANTDYNEVEKQLQLVEAYPNPNLQLIQVAKKAIINAKITNCIEELNYAVDQYQLDKINQLMDFINLNQIQLDKDLIERAQDIQEEAQDNPNFILEKQNEAKKSSKKGKK